MPLLVVVESPWAGLGCGQKAQQYLRNCIRDSLARNELPWASHAMLAWTEALYESDLEQREEGLQVGREMMMKADLVAFYIDHGLSPGMAHAKHYCMLHRRKIEQRTLYS